MKNQEETMTRPDPLSGVRSYNENLDAYEATFAEDAATIEARRAALDAMAQTSPDYQPLIDFLLVAAATVLIVAFLAWVW